MWRGRFRRITGPKHSSVTQRMLPPTLPGVSKTTSHLRRGAPPFCMQEKAPTSATFAFQNLLMPDCYTCLPFQEIPS